MRTFGVQGIEFTAPGFEVFEFVRDLRNLPAWARAFVSVDAGRARLETPARG